MKRHIRLALIVFPIWLAAQPASLLYSQAPAAKEQSDAIQIIQTVLAAHHAWVTPPASIQIQGTAIRGNTKQPVTITATRNEEAVTEYGATKRVSTLGVKFDDDGTKAAYAGTVGAFDQLDVTGVFLLSQMTQRPLRAGAPETIQTKEGRWTRIHLTGARTALLNFQFPMADELDLTVDASTNLLAGVERTFYPQDVRRRYTLGYRFSDYRDAGGILLPYRIEMAIKGNSEETILVSEYRIGVTVAPAMFQPRAESQTPIRNAK